MSVIDLNCDLGEMANDELDKMIMPYISSCNIACGGHAGDEASMRRTVLLAKEHDVAIGAHPSFPDRENFGRTVMKMSDEALQKSVRNQIISLMDIINEEKQSLHHIKPHGALYNLMAKDQHYSQQIISIIRSIDDKILIYGLAHSEAENVAVAMGQPFIGEAFADRRYQNSRELLSRKEEGAVLHNEHEVLDQVEKLVFEKKVISLAGEATIDAKTICLHSDTKGAVILAKKIHESIVSKGGHITSV